MHSLSHLHLFSALMSCLCYGILTIDSQKNHPEEPKPNPKLKLRNSCKIIALNLLGAPKTEDWRKAGSCEQACKHQLLMLTSWMAEKRTARFNMYRGYPLGRKVGPHFTIDSCLAEPRFCSQDFVYPSIAESEVAMASQLPSSLELSSSCICQRALVLTHVWEESASIGNWLKLNPQISADERPSCTLEGICRRLQKDLAPLGWQCSDSSHLVQANVDCVTHSKSANKCPCTLSTHTLGRMFCPKETCRAWPLKFPTFGRSVVLQEADQNICVDVDGVKHIANAANGRKIPLQAIRLINMDAIMSSLQQNLTAANNVLQPADERGATFHSGVGSSPNNIRSESAADEQGTSNKASAADTALPDSEDMSLYFRMYHAMGDAVDFERASSSQPPEPSDQEQFLMALQDIEQFLFADDLADFEERNAGLTSFSNMPMSAEDGNLDSLPSIPMHASLENGHERQQSEKRAGKRPRTEAGSSGTSTAAGSSSQLDSYRFMDTVTFPEANRLNLDSMPRIQTVLHLPATAAGSHSQYSHPHQPNQQYRQQQRRSQTSSLDELSVIFDSVQPPADDNPEDNLEEDDPPIL